MPRRRRQLSTLCLVILSSLLPLSWSFAELRYYDDLRLSPPEGSAARIEVGSRVVGIEPSPNDNDGADGNDGLPVRMCHLASMLPLTDGHGGLNTAGATMLAVHHFNNRNSNIVPELAREEMKRCNVQFTVEFHDTELSPIVANRILIDDISTRTHSLRTPQPIALLGASRSAVSCPLSKFAYVHDIPVVSSMSTSSQLDNTGTFPMFGRTIPADSGRAHAAASYLRDVMRVTHVGVLYLRDEWGRGFLSDFTHAALALDPPMEIVSASYDIHDLGEFSVRSAVRLLRSSGLRYFLGVVPQRTYDTVMSVVRQEGIIGPGYFWLFNEITLGGALGDHGVGVLDLGVERNDAFDQAFGVLEREDAVKEYVLSKLPHHIEMSNFTFDAIPTYWEYLEYDAVIALGLAACDAEEEFFGSESLFGAFVNTTFTGASGRVSFDRATGTRDAARLPYKVSNIAHSNRPNGTGGAHFDSTDAFYQSVVDNGRGIGNGNVTAKWTAVNLMTYADGSSVAPPVLPPIQDNHPRLGVGVVSLGLALAGLVMATSLVCAAWTVVHRKSRVVRSSQPKFLLMLCVGTFVTASCIVPMSLQEAAIGQRGLDVACMAPYWLFSLGWVISVSALFSKTLRIHKLIKRSQAFRRIRTKPMDFLIPFMVLFTCVVVVLISWTLVAPLKLTHVDVVTSVDTFGRPNAHYALCLPEEGKSELPFVALLFVLDFTSLALAAHVSYQARDIATEYNESRYVAISVASIFQAMVISVPLMILTSMHSQTDFLIRATMVSLICAAILLPLFVPKTRARRHEMEEDRLKSLLKKEKEKRLALWRRNQELNDELESFLKA